MDIASLHRIYGADHPGFIESISSAPEMQRLKDVGMNCGCEYTGFHRFLGIGSYSRFDHSVGAALIVWHFTRDIRQTVAALLHDIATPAFAHVIDFLHGDYLKQESTEEETFRIISGSGAIVGILEEYGLAPKDVADYHIFPIADNDTPRLSSDRLEYTCGNMLNYGFAEMDRVAAIYGDLCTGVNEEGLPEIMFRSRERASEFARLSLMCSKIYVSDEDRYAMQRLAELLAGAIRKGILTERMLYSTESEVIGRLLADSEYSLRWRDFRSYSRIMTCSGRPDAIVVNAKKRHINPFVRGFGRVRDFDAGYASLLEEFLEKDFDYAIIAE